MIKLGAYAAVSSVAAVAVICYAFHSREQFYPAMVYLASSKISLLLLLNMCLVLMCSVWQLMKVIFLGTLREAEVERLNEQSVREIMEILFAMTVYRQDFSVAFAGMVTVLLFIKAFHWLAQKRVEYIEITPAVSRLQHARIVTFMLLLCAIDSLFLYMTVSRLLKTKRHSVAFFFALEYVILATSTVAMLFKYGLNMVDIAMEGRWDNKAVYVFYLELVRDLLHLSLYLVFFFFIFINRGMPLHLVRELYETFRNFKARIVDFLRYKKVTSNMNERFPDATAEELERSDATCIICREEMLAAKKLPCGHLFHVHCLRSWLERQQTCPTCRSPVVGPEATPAARTVDPAVNSQQNQPSQEGQGVTVSETAGHHQASGPGNINFPNSQHQARMQAAYRAAAQYGASFVYPSSMSGNMVWYPAYVPVVPPQYMVSIPRVSMSPEPQNEMSQSNGDPNISVNFTQSGVSVISLGGVSPQSLANAQAPGLMTFYGTEAASSVARQYTSCFPVHPYPGPDLLRLSSSRRNDQDTGSSSNVRSDVDASTNLLELQQLQVKHWIELLQKQLQWAIHVQSQLEAAKPPTASDSQASEFRDSTVLQESVQNFEQDSGIVDRKGKAPEVADESISSASTSCTS